MFAVTIFLSASLLFFVQPMFAKMVLPRLGGAPSVWTTAMLFFQAALLAGYAYSHFLSTRLAIRSQIAVHVAVGLVGVAFLPIALPFNWAPDPNISPVIQSLWVFAIGVGAPFFFLSANAPLLQAWFATSGGKKKLDPFHLYAASNAGSLLALLSFPLVAEPLLGTTAISNIWAVAYVVLIGGIGLCATSAIRGARVRGGLRKAPVSLPARPSQILKWVGLAFVPSSMMLAATTVVSSDLGSFPLIWVIPLALYLLSYVLAFSKTFRPPTRLVETAFVLTLIAAIALMAINQLSYVGFVGFGVIFAAFFFIALLYHMRLHDSRPEPEGLTPFYFAMATGGALGGLFNSVVAPHVFSNVHEAPIMLALAGFVIAGERRLASDLKWALAVFLVFTVAVSALQISGALEGLGLGFAAVAGIAIATALGLAARRPYRFTVTAVLVFAIGGFAFWDSGVVHRERSFFGVYSVREHDQTGVRSLSHGTTRHGSQLISDASQSPQARDYYHRKAPMGAIFASERVGDEARVGIVGLGVGALACYARPGQSWRFYEIDPAVDRIARDPQLFSFMDKCAGDAPTISGDARISLQDDADGAFDVLLIDAYSSDSVPAHLLTTEAFELYTSKLSPDGLLILHITNRYYDLASVIGRAVRAKGLEARWFPRKDISVVDLKDGEAPSEVVIIGANETALAPFLADEQWRPLPGDGRAPWTDDSASLLSAL